MKLALSRVALKRSEAEVLWHRGCLAASEGDWQAARRLYVAASALQPGMGLARSSAALAAFQLGHAAQAELELKALIRRYPLLAEAHAAQAAVLCHRGAIEEASDCWTIATRLDGRCCLRDWLVESRRWPPLPVAALKPLFALAG